MTMLITGGKCISADHPTNLLIRMDRIETIAEALPFETAQPICRLDASGLTLMPGMIDMHAHLPLPEGVTAGLVWPDAEGICRLWRPQGAADSRLYVLQPEHHTDAHLHERMLELAHAGFQPVCWVSGAQVCRRVLGIVHSTGVKVLLAGLHACGELAEAIAMSKCAAVVAVSSADAASSMLAAHLAALSVLVAITPADSTCDLRGCAGLCRRSGLDVELALASITSVPAHLLMLPDAGQVRPGAAADLLLYDGDPLADDSTHVLTIAAGKIQH